MMMMIIKKKKKKKKKNYRVNDTADCLCSIIKLLGNNPWCCTQPNLDSNGICKQRVMAWTSSMQLHFSVPSGWKGDIVYMEVRSRNIGAMSTNWEVLKWM